MPKVGHRLSARAIGFALVAAFIAFQASLVLYTGAAGIPGLFRIDLAGEKGGAATPLHAGAQDGGESVSAKRPDTPEAPAKAPAKAPSGATGSTPAEDGEKRLEELAALITEAAGVKEYVFQSVDSTVYGETLDIFDVERAEIVHEHADSELVQLHLQHLGEGGLEPGAILGQQLIQLSNDHGGKDNVSVILAQVLEPFPARRGLLRRIREIIG